MIGSKHIFFLLTACVIAPSAFSMDEKTIYTDDAEIIVEKAAGPDSASGIVVKHSSLTDDSNFIQFKDILLYRVAEMIAGKKKSNTPQPYYPISELDIESLNKIPDKAAIVCMLRQDDWHVPLAAVNLVLQRKRQWLLVQQVDSNPNLPNICTSEDDRPFVRLFVDRQKKCAL